MGTVTEFKTFGKEGPSAAYVSGVADGQSARAGGSALTSQAPDQNHMANWIDCIRSRRQPNAPVEIGYRSAIAAHMANLAYRGKQRVTLAQAKSMMP